MGTTVASLSYGDRVNVIEESDGWARVVVPGRDVDGWVNASALTQKRIVLAAGESDVNVAASGGELALAGKGFNKEVEESYKQERGLDYTWVDRMEEDSRSAEVLVAFIVEGGLTPSEGGEAE
jgi:hypothetical protein